MKTTIYELSQELSLRTIDAYKTLRFQKKEFIMSEQVLKSVTSIGANIAESKHAESDADFVHKLAISQKECAESIYWIDLLEKSSFLESSQCRKLNNLLFTMKRKLSAIIVAKKKMMILKK